MISWTTVGVIVDNEWDAISVSVEYVKLISRLSVQDLP